MSLGLAAYAYPTEAHVRKHGPEGYRRYRSFKPWLRDEFSFRCVYCLLRETWVVGQSDFAVEHFMPKARFQHGITDYKNLFYACNSCNANKSDQQLPMSPDSHAFGSHLKVEADGSIVARTSEGRKLISICALDQPDITRRRQQMIELLDLCEDYQTIDHRFERQLDRLLGYPPELPNLERLRAPRNTLPEGEAGSFFARGPLPRHY